MIEQIKYNGKIRQIQVFKTSQQLANYLAENPKAKIFLFGNWGYSNFLRSFPVTSTITAADILEGEYEKDEIDIITDATLPEHKLKKVISDRISLFLPDNPTQTDLKWQKAAVARLTKKYINKTKLIILKLYSTTPLYVYNLNSIYITFKNRKFVVGQLL